MIDVIEKHRPQLEELCRKHKVKTLEIFGSAAEETWNPEMSDLDFLVQYMPLPAKGASSYFEILFDLEDLFDRKIDLVDTSVIKNRYFLEAVNKSRRVIYAA